MKHSLHFNLDGKWSYEMGVVQASVNTGLFEDSIISSKSIIEEKIEGREKPYFFGVDKAPLSFTVSVAFMENMSNKKVREVLRWLDHDEYKPLRFWEDDERIWYVMVVNDITSIHNGINSGYIELEFRASHTTALTPLTASDTYRIRSSNWKTIEFENSGDFDCFPIVHIEKVGSGNAEIQNASNNTGDFKLTGLEDGEVVSIDCENKEIVSSIGKFRYDNFSKNYLVFRRGINRLRVRGNFNLTFETEFKIY